MHSCDLLASSDLEARTHGVLGWRGRGVALRVSIGATPPPLYMGSKLHWTRFGNQTRCLLTDGNTLYEVKCYSYTVISCICYVSIILSKITISTTVQYALLLLSIKMLTHHDFQLIFCENTLVFVSNTN